MQFYEELRNNVYELNDPEYTELVIMRLCDINRRLEMEEDAACKHSAVFKIAREFVNVSILQLKQIISSDKVTEWAASPRPSEGKAAFLKNNVDCIISMVTGKYNTELCEQEDEDDEDEEEENGDHFANVAKSLVLGARPVPTIKIKKNRLPVDVYAEKKKRMQEQYERDILKNKDDEYEDIDEPVESEDDTGNVPTSEEKPSAKNKTRAKKQTSAAKRVTFFNDQDNETFEAFTNHGKITRKPVGSTDSGRMPDFDKGPSEYNMLATAPSARTIDKYVSSGANFSMYDIETKNVYVFSKIRLQPFFDSDTQNDTKVLETIAVFLEYVKRRKKISGMETTFRCDVRLAPTEDKEYIIPEDGETVTLMPVFPENTKNLTAMQKTPFKVEISDPVRLLRSARLTCYITVIV